MCEEGTIQCWEDGKDGDDWCDDCLDNYGTLTAGIGAVHAIWTYVLIAKGRMEIPDFSYWAPMHP